MPFQSPKQRRYLYASKPAVARKFAEHEPSRRTQPYRKGARNPGRTLSAMLAGKPAFMDNPMDVRRRAQKGSSKTRRSGRRRRSLADLMAP